MRNLYLTDLKRLFKDKLFLITVILALAFALFNPLLYYALFQLLELGDLLGQMVNAKSLLFTAFLPSDNLGLILPILIAIIICKDFSQGTVRNKIICGNARHTIFLSHFLSSSTVLCGLMLIHGLLTLIFSLCFFDYQPTKFTASDFGYLMLSLLFEMLVYLAISAIVTFIATLAKNTGLCILFYLALSFGASIIGSVLQMAGMALNPQSTEYAILEFFNALNIYTSSFIGAGESYEAKEILYILLPSLAYGVGCTLLGIRLFSRKNLK